MEQAAALPERLLSAGHIGLAMELRAMAFVKLA